MFKQNPHPFYEALLENDYSFVPTHNPKWFKWYCGAYQVVISNESGVISVRDHKTQEMAIFSFMPDDFDGSFDSMQKLIKEYVVQIKESLDSKKTDIMKIVIAETLKISKNIEKINFLPGTRKGKKFLRIIDQNNIIYQVNDKNITDLIFNFHFIHSLSLDSHLVLKRFSNHDFLENFEKYEKLKKELGIKLKIKKIG